MDDVVLDVELLGTVRGIGWCRCVVEGDRQRGPFDRRERGLRPEILDLLLDPVGPAVAAGGGQFLDLLGQLVDASLQFLDPALLVADQVRELENVAAAQVIAVRGLGAGDQERASQRHDDRGGELPAAAVSGRLLHGEHLLSTISRRSGVGGSLYQRLR
ncbi:hypothetical protein CLV30_10424 [Haloactinopolyspora alba]|uniref:Uncharacterized protein n=1 Tax=Haloactinopolyspora alba TaxID=648780 RepID=A0A2P8E6P7_9ACTN|nr:hypothetical protein [Haloactinopolyspora alba]PSL05162.1 hypothetical protein CLV30_10424 [Haloactinopolyspora alba]